MTDAESLICAGEINTSGKKGFCLCMQATVKKQFFPPLCGSEGCTADVSVMDVKGACQECTEMRFLMSEGCQLINLCLESMFPIIDDVNQF